MNRRSGSGALCISAVLACLALLSQLGATTWRKIDIPGFAGPVATLATDLNGRVIFARGRDTSSPYLPRLFVSRDRGNTWQDLSPNLPGSTVGSVAVAPHDPSTVYLGGVYGGVNRSVDTGRTWEGCSRGLTGMGGVTTFSFHPDSDRSILIGGEDVFRTSTGGDTWVCSNLGITNPYVQSFARRPPTPELPNTVYSSSRALDMTLVAHYGGVYRSNNGGGLWSECVSGIPEIADTGPIALDPTCPETLYIAVNDYVRRQTTVYRTENGGENWHALAGGALPTSECRNPICLRLNPLNPAVAYLSLHRFFDHPYFYRTANHGETWELMTPGLPDSVEVTEFVVLPVNPPRILICSSTGLWCWEDSSSVGTSEELVKEQSRLSLRVHIAGTTCRIEYSLDKTSAVRLKILDVAGRGMVEVDQGYEPPGEHRLTLSDDFAHWGTLAPGIYFIRLVSGSQAASVKVVRLE